MRAGGMLGAVVPLDMALTKARSIVQLGDSITTHGFGADPAGPPNSAKAILAWTVMASQGHLRMGAGDANIYAHAGYTSGELIADGYHTQAAASGAEFCTVHVGTNDAGDSAYSTQGTRDNLTLIYSTLTAAGITPVLVTVPPRGDSSTARPRVNEINAWLATTAAANGWPFVDTYSLLADAGGLWADAANVDPDNIHPTEEGAKVIGEEVSRVLRNVARIRKSLAGFARQANASLLDPNPLFADANADGLPDGWARIGTVVAQDAKNTITDPDVYGNWFRAVRGAGGNGQAIYRGASVNATAGDRLRISFRFKITSLDVVNAATYTAMLQQGPNGSGGLAGFNWNRPVADGYWSEDVVVPATWTGVQMNLTPGAGTAAAAVDADGQIAQLTVLNLTTLGLA